MKKSQVLFVNTQEVRCGRCGSHILRSTNSVMPECGHRWRRFSTDYTAHPYTDGDAWATTTGPHGIQILPFIPRSEIEFT